MPCVICLMLSILSFGSRQLQQWCWVHAPCDAMLSAPVEKALVLTYYLWGWLSISSSKQCYSVTSGHRSVMGFDRDVDHVISC